MFQLSPVIMRKRLSDAELLAILLRTGTKDLNVLKLAQKVLQKFEKEKFVDVSIDDLKDDLRTMKETG